MKTNNKIKSTDNFWLEWFARCDVILGESCTLVEAAEKMSNASGKHITKGGIRAAYLRRGGPSAGSLLKEMPVVQAAQAVPRPASTILEEGRAHRRERRLIQEHDDLARQLQEALARASFVDGLRQPVTPSIPRHERNGGPEEGALIVLLSDVHFEEVVELERMDGLNEYNVEIAKKRLDRFARGVRWKLEHERQDHVIRNLVLAVLGDLMTGYIHRELEETNDLTPIETVLELKGVLNGMIKSLLEDPLLDRIDVPCVPGNHGRVQEKKRAKTYVENSFEWLLYNIVKDEWKDEPRVQFHVSKSPHQYLNAFGAWDLHFTHGDEARYKDGVGGISVPLLKAVNSWNKIRHAHYHHIGHFHQKRDFEEILVNGSVIGYSEYSRQQKYRPEAPQQLAYLLDAKRGKSNVSPIWVTDAT